MRASRQRMRTEDKRKPRRGFPHRGFSIQRLLLVRRGRRIGIGVVVNADLRHRAQVEIVPLGRGVVDLVHDLQIPFVGTRRPVKMNVRENSPSAKVACPKTSSCQSDALLGDT